jgi:hypothetical protein
VALLQRARFTTALAACGVGLAVCGVTLAVAGESPHPPADPLTDLPGEVQTVQNTPCDANAAAAVGGGGFGQVPCYHLVIVRSARGETGTQLADRLADHYTRRGFPFGVIGGPEPRQYIAKNACQTMLSITTSPMGGVPFGPNPNGVLDPGALNGLTDPNASLDPAAGQPEGGPSPATPTPATPTPAAPPANAGASTASTAAAPTAGATAARGLLGQTGPSTTAGAAATSSVPAAPPGSTPGRTAGKSGKPGPATTIRPGSQPGGEVILSAQVANAASGLC